MRIIKRFDQIFAKIQSNETKKVAVAVAQDEEVLEAVRDAKAVGAVDAILVGDKQKIQVAAAKIGMDITNFELIHHKGLLGPVAGKDDIFLLPNFEVANVMYKTLTYTSKAKYGGILVGTTAPVIITSRADSHKAKVNSIVLAALVANHKA